MDFEQYVVARRTRLVEHAVELGVPVAEAPALVDRVLAAERSTVERAEDPDPGVREALEAAALGRPRRPRRSRTAIAAVAALVLVAALGVVGVARQLDLDPPSTPRVPTTFTLDVDGATAVLTDAGYLVERIETRRCETPGQVLGTTPRPGDPAAEGSTVTVDVAVLPGLSCPPGAGFRADVWAFLRWVAGLGPAPDLVDEPTVVVVEGSGTRTTRVARAELEARVGDADLLGALRSSLTTLAPTATGFPELTVRNGTTPPPCDAPSPDDAAGLLTVRFDLDATAFGDDPCPLTGYLVPDREAIDMVVLVVPSPDADPGLAPPA